MEESSNIEKADGNRHLGDRLRGLAGHGILAVAKLLSMDRKTAAQTYGQAIADAVAGEQINFVVDEWLDRISKNKADPEWGKSDQACECFSELLDLLENEKPETARIKAMRRAFLAAARGDLTESPLPLQYMKVISRMTGGSILVLGAADRLRRNPELMTDEFIKSISDSNYPAERSWKPLVAKLSGILNDELLENYVKELEAKKVFRSTFTVQYSNDPDQHRHYCVNRMTSLGSELCDFLQKAE